MCIQSFIHSPHIYPLLYSSSGPLFNQTFQIFFHSKHLHQIKLENSVIRCKNWFHWINTESEIIVSFHNPVSTSSDGKFSFRPRVFESIFDNQNIVKIDNGMIYDQISMMNTLINSLKTSPLITKLLVFTALLIKWEMIR